MNGIYTANWASVINEVFQNAVKEKNLLFFIPPDPYQVRVLVFRFEQPVDEAVKYGTTKENMYWDLEVVPFNRREIWNLDQGEMSWKRFYRI